MAQRIRAHDWTSTPLGPIESWPLSLRTTLTTVLDHPLPMALAWGPQLIALYNDAYLPLLDATQAGLGSPFLDIWTEARETVAPQIAASFAGASARLERIPFKLQSHGNAKGAYFDYSFCPVRDESGELVGVLNIAVETTGRVLAEQQRQDVDAALRESEARFRALVTTGASSIYRRSPDWRTMYQLDSDTLANTTEPIEDWVEKYIFEEDRAQAFTTQHPRQVAVLFSNTWLTSMLSCLSDKVIAADADGCVRYLNPMAERLTGWKNQEARGKSIEEVYRLRTVDDEPVPQCQLRKALLTRASVGKQRFPLHTKEEGTVLVEDSASPILDGNRLIGAVTIFLDITGRTAAEKAIRENEKLAVVGRLASSIAHEINNPLEAVTKPHLPGCERR